MSGQPVKTQADVNKFKNEYLETLALQESINDMNLQANKTYLLTGQLPPQSQMQDTRTTAEKLADVEKLKQEIASALAPIAEPQLAYAIVSKVMESPLNLDNTLLRFLAQRASSIVEQLKKIMPYGIAGDANDIETIVNNIKSMYTEQQGKFQSTKSYLNSLSSSGSSSKVISGNDIDNIILGLEDINKSLNILRGTGGFVFAPLIDRISNTLITLKDCLPTTEQIKLLLQDIENPAFNNPYPDGALNLPPYNRADLEAFYKMMEKLPKYSEVNTLIKKIKQYISSNNYTQVNQGLVNLEKMFMAVEGINDNNFIQSFRQLKQRQALKQEQQGKLNSEQTRNFIRRQTEAQRDISKSQKVYVVNPQDDAVWIRNTNMPQGNQQAQMDPNNLPPPPIAQRIADYLFPQAPPAPPAPPAPVIGNNPNLPNLAFPFLNNLPAPAAPAPAPANFPNRANFDVGNDNLRNYINNLTEPELDYIINSIRINFPNQTVQGQQFTNFNRDIRGVHNKKLAVMRFINNRGYNGTNYQLGDLGFLGFGLKKRRGRPRGSGMPKPIVQKIPNFVGFGISEINQKSLAKGILSVRRNTRTNYPEMPSRRISDNMKNIVKTMIGGGVPKYEDLGKLDNDEKEYLHKLVSKSEMTDRLSVPAPSKDQQEKDIHNFEVLKGQILSGNDSQDLVKKFKLLIMKLSKQGLLPRGQVDDLLETLVVLGY